MAKSNTGLSPQDRYKKLLEKVNSLNLGGGGWWKAPVGISVIRILPPVGTMDYFFLEVGQHYIGDSKTPFYCPAICTEGEMRCPICDVNEELYKAGEKEAASQFRAGRSFFMNIIDRAHPDGVLKWAPGTTIFGYITSAITDPDYGDVTDADEGYDFKLERVGTGREDTKYQGRPVKRSTPLGTPEQIAEWLNTAEDLKAWVMNQLLSYDELANKSGVDVYFAEAEDADDIPEPPRKQQSKTLAGAPAKRVKEPEPDDEDEDEDDEEPPAKPSASARIGGLMAARQQRADLLKRK